MDYSKITKDFVEQKLIDIFKKLNFNYQYIKIRKGTDSFDINIQLIEGRYIPTFKISSEYFEDNEREKDLEIKLKQTIEKYK